MIRPIHPVTRHVTRLWHTDTPLTITGLVLAALLPLMLAGLWLDPRTVGGAAIWLKPAKFAASIAIYTLTLAWIFTWLPTWPRVRRVVGRLSAAVFGVEMVIIVLQAARGTTSHFNTATLFDGVLFSIMGAGIVLQSLASIVVLVALWRQRFADRAMGWALRLGMATTVVAAFSGGLMTQPTAAQLDEARTMGRMTTSGAHTVGAPDGGAGLPGTGWSTAHGDLRVAHFAGLHAMQVLPLVALAIARIRRWHPDAQARAVIVASASYAGLFVVLIWQALRGQSVVAPDAVTAMVVATWSVATIVALFAATWATSARANVNEQVVSQ
jgi:hypothetical protein